MDGQTQACPLNIECGDAQAAAWHEPWSRLYGIFQRPKQLFLSQSAANPRSAGCRDTTVPKSSGSPSWPPKIWPKYASPTPPGPTNPLKRHINRTHDTLAVQCSAAIRSQQSVRNYEPDCKLLPEDLNEPKHLELNEHELCSILASAAAAPKPLDASPAIATATVIEPVIANSQLSPLLKAAPTTIQTNSKLSNPLNPSPKLPNSQRPARAPAQSSSYGPTSKSKQCKFTKSQSKYQFLWPTSSYHACPGTTEARSNARIAPPISANQRESEAITVKWTH